MMWSLSQVIWSRYNYSFSASRMPVVLASMLSIGLVMPTAAGRASLNGCNSAHLKER
jgi:hypothetical protein